MSNGIIWSLSSGRSNYFSSIISTYLRRLNSNFDSVICCFALAHRCKSSHYPIGHGTRRIGNTANDKTTSDSQWSLQLRGLKLKKMKETIRNTLCSLKTIYVQQLLNLILRDTNRNWPTPLINTQNRHRVISLFNHLLYHVL